ncbi:MAG: hypothetical protein QW040_02665 [Candidatus Aenigmatarchaeota archaeon]
MAKISKIKEGVIPTTGMGSRIGFSGYILPKPLLPLYDKPTIHYIIEKFIYYLQNLIKLSFEKTIVVEELAKENYLNIFTEKIFNYIKKTSITLPCNEKEINTTIGLVAGDGMAYGEFINGINININKSEDLPKTWLLLDKNNLLW